MTAVYSCVRILAEAVAGLPLHLYRYKEDGAKEKALDHSLYLLLHDEPNPEMSAFVFRETLMTNLPVSYTHLPKPPTLRHRAKLWGLQWRFRWTKRRLATSPSCWMPRVA